MDHHVETHVGQFVPRTRAHRPEHGHRPDPLVIPQWLLDALVRDAVGAWKALQQGRRWDAVVAVARMRKSLLALRGRRDSLRLDPADPAGALTRVLAEATASFDFGPRRAALLAKISQPG